MNRTSERRLLQLAMLLGCLVPLTGGTLGIVLGTGMLGTPVADPGLDSHMRYLSGLLLGIGLGYMSIIPTIEKQGARAALLTSIVVLGGFARLYSHVHDSWPATPMTYALVMELGVVPALYLWQRRIAQIWNSKP